MLSRSRLVPFFLMAIIMSSLLAGCVQGASSTQGAPSPDVNIPSPIASQRAKPPASAYLDLPELSDGNGAFAFDLYQSLREEDGNLFFSPYSISAALAMTYAGARGETEQQMAQTLHYALAQERLHPAFNALDQELAAAREAGQEAFQIEVANSLWGQEGFPFQQVFIDGLKASYGAGLRSVDFVDAQHREAARRAINVWVEERTQGKIKNLIPEDILTNLTRLVLANAIYFKGEWVAPFHHGTRDAPFTRLDDSQVTVPMMSRRSNAPYAVGENYQAVEIPYKGNRISMLVLLPDEGEWENFEAALNRERVDSIVQSLHSEDVKLYLPKFSFRSNLMLANILASMGMPDAFDPVKADFTGMFHPEQTSESGLHLSHVVHQAFVAVDEEGTEAAAATGVVAEVESMPVELRVDRPLIFLILDRETGTVLFLGRLLDPSIED